VPDWLRGFLDEVRGLYAAGFAAALVVGAVAPLLGTLLVARRAPLLALVVPEVAGLGVALSYFAFPALSALGLAAGQSPSHAVQMVGAAVGVGGGLALAALIARPGDEMGFALAIAFVLAGAGAEVLLLESRFHEFSEEWLHHGRLLTVLEEGAWVVAAGGAAAVLGFLALRRRLLRAAFDPDCAALRGERPRLSALQGDLLVGGFVAVVVPEVGPDVVLASLLIPPILLRRAARSTRAYLALCVLSGASGAALAFVLALAWDWAMGPALTLATLAASSAIAVVLRLRPEAA
jgi:zinc transport system permease protein